MSKAIFKRAAVAAILSATFLTSPAYASGSGDAYIGVSVGYGWNTADASTTTVFSPTGYFATTSVPAIETSGMQQVKPNAFDAGIDIGYDYHAGSLLIGIAADISTMNKSKSVSTTTVYPCCAPTDFTITQTVKPTWMATVRARLGYDVGGSTIYATGGWAGEQVRYTALFTDTFATANESATASKFRSGWVVGGGADIALGGGWSIQPEYLHADYGTWTIPGGTLTAFSPPISFPTNVFTHSVKLKTDLVRVGMHYHF